MRERALCAIGAVVVGGLCLQAAADVPQITPETRGIGSTIEAPLAAVPAEFPRSVVVRMRAGIRVVEADTPCAVAFEGHNEVTRVRAEQFAAAMESIGGVRVRPIASGFANPALAREIGLDRYLVLTTDGGMSPEDVAALAGSYVDIVTDASAERIAYIVNADSGQPTWVSSNPPGGSPPGDGGQPGDPFYVNDPLFEDQHSLENNGQDVGGDPGLTGADISARDAWELAGCGAGVTIAVVDGGVSPDHPDLIDRLVPGHNTIGDPADTDDKSSSHGTHVAGIIGATINNQIGIAGVAGRSNIMPIRVFNELGFGGETQFSQGLIWAADNGADIASMSVGYPFDTQLMRDAVVYARGQGVLMVSSTGNTPGQSVQFPAKHPQTLAIGATTHVDEVWSNSTTGPEITMVAPGAAVLSTWDTPSDPLTYKAQSGTSMAVPHVSGTAALMLGVNPELTPDEIGWALTRSAMDLGGEGWNESSGYGRLDASLAVAIALSLGDGATPSDVDGDGTATPVDIQLFVQYYSDGDLRADLAMPFGTLDLGDINAFVTGFVP